MNFSTVMSSAPRLLNARDSEDYVCGTTMLKQFVERWGLRPIEKGKRLTVYDRFDIDAVIERKERKRELFEELRPSVEYGLALARELGIKL